MFIGQSSHYLFSCTADTEVFKIKRSSHSRRVAKQMKKELKDNGKAGEGGTDIDDSMTMTERNTEEQREKKKKDVYDEEEAIAAAEKIKVEKLC